MLWVAGGAEIICGRELRPECDWGTRCWSGRAHPRLEATEMPKALRRERSGWRLHELCWETTELQTQNLIESLRLYRAQRERPLATHAEAERSHVGIIFWFPKILPSRPPLLASPAGR